MATEDTDLSATAEQADALRQTLDDLDSRSRSFGAALGGALTSATTGGKSLDNVLRGLANRLTDIALSSGLKPLETAISGAAGDLTGGLAGNLGKLFAFADGGVPGRVTAFADGGVVSQPRYFPMGGDLGLMGEAGSEAILPLKRGPDGSLGVATPGGASTQIVFNVTATDAGSFQKSEAQISAMLARTTMRGRRNL